MKKICNFNLLQEDEKEKIRFHWLYRISFDTVVANSQRHKSSFSLTTLFLLPNRANWVKMNGLKKVEVEFEPLKINGIIHMEEKKL